MPSENRPNNVVYTVFGKPAVLVTPAQRQVQRNIEKEFMVNYSKIYLEHENKVCSYIFSDHLNLGISLMSSLN